MKESYEMFLRRMINLAVWELGWKSKVKVSLTILKMQFKKLVRPAVYKSKKELRINKNNIYLLIILIDF